MKKIDKSLFNDLIVVKRSGQRVSFNELKIAVAIKKSFDSMNKNYDEKIINKVYEDVLKYILDNYRDRKTINVEDIQDIIEHILKESKLDDVYSSFSEYRNRRSESRKSFSLKQQHKFGKAIEKIETVKNNNERPETMLYKFGKIISEEYTKAYVLDNKYERALEEGKIYIHNLPYFDLGYLGNTNLDIRSMLANDESLYDIINLLISSQSEIQGEIMISSLDKIFDKYIIDNFFKIFINILSKYLNISGYLEFINYKKLEERLKKEASIDIDFVNYQDIFSNELLGRIFRISYNDAKNFIEERLCSEIRKLLFSLNSNGENKKYSFSISYDKRAECKIVFKTIIKVLASSLRFKNVTVIFKISGEIPEEEFKEISSLIIGGKNILIKTGKEDEEYFANGLRIYENIYADSSTIGRSNIGSISINMARLGLKYKSLNKEFYLELDDTLELTKNELLNIFENIGDRLSNSYDVLFSDNIFDDEKLESGQKIRKVIKNGTLNINLIGLKECISLTSQDNSDDIIKLLQYINKKLKDYTLENRLNFTLSSYPSSSAGSFFTSLDKTIYGLIKGINNKENYDNLKRITSVDNLSLIEEYTKYLDGGSYTILHLKKNISDSKLVNILKILSNSEIGIVRIVVGDDLLE